MPDFARPVGDRFFEDYRGPGDDFFGSVGSRPEIYPVYWSRAQMEARQSDRMARVQRFLNGLWRHESDGETWFDPSRDSLYPDRIRRRPPGANSSGLGTHLDPGTLDLWMTREYQQAFRHRQKFHHAAILMHAIHGDALAAVRLPGSAGDTSAAVLVRNNGYQFAGMEPLRMVAGNDLPGQLMSQDARIVKIGLRAFKGVQIRSANAYLLDLYNGMTWLQLRHSAQPVFKVPGSSTDKCFHCN